jgi:glycosyltransferase involved in cell wall biosynthesis
VTFGMDVGGLEKLLVEFARHADRDRFDLHFVSLGTRGRVGDDIEALGWPVTALGLPTGIRPRLVTRLAGLFRRGRADVVHTHETRALFYSGPAARLTRVGRVIHTRHGVINQTSRQLFLLVQMARLADRVVCISDDCVRDSIALGIPEGKLVRIWNGIDLNRFAYTGPAAGGPILAVGRLDRVKGHDVLIRAAAEVARSDPAARFEIAGDGRYRPDLERLIANLDIKEHVHLLGEVEDVPGLLGRAGLFTQPSRTEGISLTLLEAMARGLPVVATRVGGNAEVVDDGVNGILIASEDPAALAGVVRDLRADPDRARDLGRAARRRIEEAFDVRRMVAEYETLYRGAAGAGRETS